MRTDELYLPTAEELRRWEAPEVIKFRKKLAPYLFVNGVIVVASIVGGSDYYAFTVFWSIYLAFKYAKLWSDGYDWRDVFRQPRDRDLIDVADDGLTYLRAIFNRNERQAMREQRRARLGRTSGPTELPRLPGLSSGDVVRGAGNFGDRIRKAEMDRDEVLRMLNQMPSAERSRIPDVGRSAEALADKVKYLAVALADLDRGVQANGSAALEAEIGYWRQKLAGASQALELPTDWPRPALQSFRGAQLPVALPRELSEAVKALGIPVYLSGMARVNPKYVLRNWVAETAIRAVQDRGDVATLGRIFRLLQSPYDEHPEDAEFAAPPPPSLCGLEVSCSS